MGTANFNLEKVLVVPLQDDTVMASSSSFIKLVKQKEDYNIYSLSENPLYFSISVKSCKGEEEVLYSGNLTKTTSYLFTPPKDGEYIIRYTTYDNKEGTHTFSHYPYLTSSFIEDLKRLMAEQPCKPKNSCENSKETRCLDYQNLYGEMMLLFGLSRTLSSCNGSYNVLQQGLYEALALYQCELYSYFCAKQVDLKIKESSIYNENILKKIVSIIYLLLYFNEKEISNQEEEYLNYVDTKFDFKVIKDYVLKNGIDILEIEHIFMSEYYRGCTEGETCTFGCITYENVFFEEEYVFELDEVINSIYDTRILKNICGTNELYVNNLLYRDSDITVMIRSTAGTNPTTVGPGEEIPVNMVIKGSKKQSVTIVVPFVIDGVTIGKYTLIFKKATTNNNTAPIITDIIKVLDNRESYTFTTEDFKNHFTDPDNDDLESIVIEGDTSNFTLNGAPYISGTLITKNNITGLTYTANNVDNGYELVVKWKAFDSRGAESN